MYHVPAAMLEQDLDMTTILTWKKQLKSMFTIH